MGIIPFKFERKRGIVWVCDIKNSSFLMNSEGSVDDLEKFIPKLYFVSKLIVEAFNGEFIKWTGDGFLAFFTVEIERDFAEIKERALQCIFALNLITKMTNLGDPKNSFELKNGVTYEKDALFMRIKSGKHCESIDIIGRDIVLAFRLSSLESSFPSILTTEEVVGSNSAQFIKLKLTSKMMANIFKSEGYKTTQIHRSVYEGRAGSRLTDRLQNIIDNLERRDDAKTKTCMNNFLQEMKKGPTWCKELIQQIEKQMEQMIEALEKLAGNFNNRIYD